MEGSRLIIKRRIPRGRERLIAVFAGGLAVIGLVMLGQLKTTLSARSLNAVKSDVTNMRVQFGSDLNAATSGEPVEETSPAPAEATSPGDAAADTSVEKLKKLLQDAETQP